MGCLKHLLGVILILVMAQVAYAEGSRGVEPKGDALPWPWGTECPIPWEEMEGLWQVKDLIDSVYFEFTVVSILDNGSRLFEINRYNSRGLVVSTGRGIAPRGQKIIRAAMHSNDESIDEREAYWAIFRAYVEGGKAQCSSGELIREITIRPFTNKESDGDLHYVIEKMQEGPEQCEG